MPTIIVCLKYAIDVSQIRIEPATRRLIITTAPRKISDFDKNALEEAVRIKEKFGGKVIALTLTTEDASSALREALAIGADTAFLIKDPLLKDADAFMTAFILAKAINKIGKFDLILCGEASIDSYSAQVGPRLGEILGLPVISYVRKLGLENNVVIAERSLEECSEVVKAQLPVLITVTKEINVPRVPTLMDVIKASKKEVVTWSLSDLGVPNEEVKAAIEVLEVSAPRVERKKMKIEGESANEVAEKVVKALIQEGILKL
ncbi:MAG: electron transfer flavoprotein subunit beta/FixA family protein [Candidatus Bathyarchaeia archaeon]